MLVGDLRQLRPPGRRPRSPVGPKCEDSPAEIGLASGVVRYLRAESNYRDRCRAGGLAALPIDRFDEALQTVARSITQVRVHERLLRLAGVRLDRAGATLLFKLSAKGESLRVTDLAEMLGVDTPTVTRKVQQLERDGMVVRQSDPDDRRASRIGLTPAGRRTIERVRRARRAWLDRLLQGWDDDDLSDLADLLSRFAENLDRDMDEARD